MKAGSLLDDDAVALRESRASPSSGKVHLFFSIEVCDPRNPNKLTKINPRKEVKIVVGHVTINICLHWKLNGRRLGHCEQEAYCSTLDRSKRRLQMISN
jgi:hypothetical protein